METIFDHNLTQKEKSEFLDKDVYLKVVDKESSLFALALLFHLRGDKERVLKYLKELPPSIVNDFWRLVTHP